MLYLLELYRVFWVINNERLPIGVKGEKSISENLLTLRYSDSTWVCKKSCSKYKSCFVNWSVLFLFIYGFFYTSGLITRKTGIYSMCSTCMPLSCNKVSSSVLQINCKNLLGHKDYLFRFWRSEVKGQGHCYLSCVFVNLSISRGQCEESSCWTNYKLL